MRPGMWWPSKKNRPMVLLCLVAVLLNLLADNAGSAWGVPVLALLAAGYAWGLGLAFSGWDESSDLTEEAIAGWDQAITDHRRTLAHYERVTTARS